MIQFNTLARISLPLIVLMASGSLLLARQATVTESRQVFRTYPFGDPDPVARMSNIYPYFRFEGYSVTPVDKEWKVVTLENPYIRVVVAPEIGGKILGAFEKSTGKAFIYFNKVVKFREIAMRGPWTSGGIEFNFGDIGHTPATATPVDYLIRTNADSSVSCIVGSIDLPSRTEWRVEIRLPRDKAYFQTESFWYNPTDFNTSLYHWMNAAADASPDLHIIYPGTGYIDHGGRAFPWPVNAEGRDLSRYANNDFGSSKSYHVLGAYTDTYAAYWSKDDFGAVHWSPYTDKPGKKMWIWALAREGEIWKNLLTDPELGNNQYVEIQSGLLFNQAGGGSTLTPFKHQFFAPASEENFVEAWFPFRDTGGMVEANLSGTLNVQRVGSTVKIGFCPLGKTVQPLIVKYHGREVLRKNLNLQPLQVSHDSVRVEGEGEVEMLVGDLLSYRSGDAEERKLHRPLVTNKEFDWNSVQGLYTSAVEYARQRDYRGALRQYEACLAKDPAHTGALTGAAEIYVRRMEYEKAFGLASKALANDAYDPDANFVYGVVSRNLGRLYDALDGFGAAARSMKYRSAANAEMAEIAFIQKNWPAAEAYAFRSLDYNRSGIRASRLLAVLYRIQSNSADARNAADHLAALDPLSHHAAFEHYLLEKSPARLAVFKSLIRGELPSESYLELASYYLSLRMFSDALAVLEQAPSHPIVSYWMAYLSDVTGDQANVSHNLADAVAASTALVFPFRQESAEILTWAKKIKPHWKTDYYRALAYWSKDRIDVAKEELLACRNEPAEWSFYLTRGNFFRREQIGDPRTDYTRALELGKNAWRPYHTLVDYDISQASFSSALEVAQAGVKSFPASYIALFDLSRSYLYNGQAQSSVKILDTLTVLPFEGARYTRDLYRQACIVSAAEMMHSARFADALTFLGKAREWPERLGVGKPYEVDTRFEDFLEAQCREKLGDQSHAKTLRDAIISYTRKHLDDWSVHRLFGALATRDQREEKAATSLPAEWTKKEASDATRWLRSVYQRNADQAQEIERKIRGTPSGSLLGRSTIDQEFALLVQVHSVLNRPGSSANLKW
jgi:tetratricopeptide (TPR) repeat protein